MEKDKKKRVVITGTGILSPIGSEPGNYWKNLLDGKNGISDLELEHLSTCYTKKYGLLNQEEVCSLAEKYLSDEEKKMTNTTKYAMISAIMAADDAGINFDTFEDRMNTGVFIGTNQSDSYLLSEDEHNSSEDLFTVVPAVAEHFGIHGCSLLLSNACASGNHAIGIALEAIKSGKLDSAIAGGSESFAEYSYAGFVRLKGLSHDSIKPFDKNRNGTILSEGSAVLIMESLEHAEKRNAVIYAEVLGYGLSNDAYSIVAPDPSAAEVISAMEQAISKSGIKYTDVDVLSLHGTGTAANDAGEINAVGTVFKEHTPEIYATSIKSTLGHQTGAASAVSMATSVLMLRDGIVPPTMNVADPEDTGFHLVKDKAEKADINVIMNNAYAFGGSNCCVVIRKWNEENE